MAKVSSSAGADFRVILQGLKLKPEIEKRIEIGIRRVVMEELASLDLKGDLQISPIDKFPTLAKKESFIAGGHTAGIRVQQQ